MSSDVTKEKSSSFSSVLMVVVIVLLQLVEEALGDGDCFNSGAILVSTSLLPRVPESTSNADNEPVSISSAAALARC